MASLYHLQVNVSDAKVSLPFYKDFFTHLQYKIISEDTSHIGVKDTTSSFWIIETEEKYKQNGFHRKNTGLNHIAFRVDSKQEVDEFVTNFLIPRKLVPLYGGPKLFPEYTLGYYAVFFEDPDRIKLEIAYIPK